MKLKKWVPLQKSRAMTHLVLVLTPVPRVVTLVLGEGDLLRFLGQLVMLTENPERRYLLILLLMNLLWPTVVTRCMRLMVRERFRGRGTKNPLPRDPLFSSVSMPRRLRKLRLTSVLLTLHPDRLL